ncbi:MAG: AraC family transcriptional regulator [Gemmatimonadota bacterium]|nr:AraC family transcriptional regulator [Gemmatimonadota bacterium]
MPSGSGWQPPYVVVYAPHERTRTLVRRALPHRRWHAAYAHTTAKFAGSFRAALVDAAIVDLAAPVETALGAAALARDFPTVPFFGLSPYLLGDTPTIARAVELEFADILAEGIDDAVLGAAVGAYAFTPRFISALRDPPPLLGLTHAIQLAAWRALLACPGRAVATAELARRLGVTREHLSRSFRGGGAPTLKRVSDLVRLLAASRLAKNPGYDLDDVARLLRFPSRAHLSRTARRLVGRTAASLPRLRTADLLREFDHVGASSRRRD